MRYGIKKHSLILFLSSILLLLSMGIAAQESGDTGQAQNEAEETQDGEDGGQTIGADQGSQSGQQAQAGNQARDTNPTALLAYFGNKSEIEVAGEGGTSRPNITYGMELRVGDTVSTNGTIAELKLEPNGSIIKLSRNTAFTVDELQRSEDSTNAFSMAKGKMRAVAASVKKGNRYRVSTPSAVCGVRGTDFGVISKPGGEEERAFVAQGQLEYRKQGSDTSILLNSREMASALEDTLRKVKINQDQLNNLLQDVQFEALNPQEVPGHETDETTVTEEEEAEDEGEEEADSETEEAAAEEEASEGEIADETGEQGEQAADGEETEGDETETGEQPAGETIASPRGDVPAQSGFEAAGLTPGLTMLTGEAQPRDTDREGIGDGPVAKFLGEYLGFEIGTITMDGSTYSKAVVQPTIEAGKLKLSLYLPFIYKEDLFDPNEWYEPEGNDEWSFGTDKGWKDEPLKAAQDAAQDLALKIHYLQWGEQRDPFYVKLGNLDNMKLGHGSIMENYANDIDFPSVRQIGLNLGVEGEGGGFEIVTNDIADPEIFGGRVFVRPVGKWAIGASAVADIAPLSAASPESDWDEDEVLNKDDEDYPDSMSFIAGGVDTELPIFESELLSIIPFADAAALVPEQNGNYRTELVYENGTFRNYGLSAGILGNVAMVDYTLAYRYYNGLYRHPFFGATYERTRGKRAEEVNTYLDALDDEGPTTTSPYDKTSMGIYGDAGATILSAFEFSAGYMLPWEKVDPNNPETYRDEFSMSFRILPDVIPVLGIHGGVSYRRTHFVPMVLGEENMEFFDAYSDFSGEVVVPISPTIDLAGVFSTSLKRDNEGNIDYDNNGNPETVPNITIETRVSF